MRFRNRENSMLSIQPDRRTPILAISVLAVGVAFLACAPAEEEAEAPAEEPAVREVPAPVGEIVVIKGDAREFHELTPGNAALMTASDVGDPNAMGSVAGSTTTAHVIAHWENYLLENWTYTYDEYIYGLEGGVLTIETEDGVFDVGPGDGLWIPKGTVATRLEAGERATNVIGVYPVDWTPADENWSMEGEPAPVSFVAAADRQIVHYGPGISTGSDVGPASAPGVVAVADTLHCALTVLDNFDTQEQRPMPFDEYLYNLDGHLTILSGENSHEVGPGDAIWLPKGAMVQYKSEQSTLMAMIYPANWQEQMAAAQAAAEAEEAEEAE